MPLEQQVESEPIIIEEVEEQKVEEPSPVKQGWSGYVIFLNVALFLSVAALGVVIGLLAGGPVGAIIGAGIGVGLGVAAVFAVNKATQDSQGIVPDKNPVYPEIESGSEGEKIKPPIGVSQNKVFPSAANPDVSPKATVSKETSHSAKQQTTHSTDQKNTNVPT